MADDGSHTPGVVVTEADDMERCGLKQLTADEGSASAIVHVAPEDVDRYGLVAPAGLGPLPPIPSINVTEALLCDRSLPAELPQEGDGGSSQFGKRQSMDGSGVPHQGLAVAHCYKASEGHDSRTSTLGDEARSQGYSNESSRLWRQDKFLAEFGGMAYKPVADAGAAGSSESSLSSCLRALSGVASDLSANPLPSSSVDQQVTSYLAAVLEWAGALEAKMETAYSSDRSEEERKVKSLEIAEDILQKVQELYATSGKHAQQPVRVLVVPCGWMEDTVQDVDRAVLVLERKQDQDECALWWCHAGEGCRERHPSKNVDEFIKLYRTVLHFPKVKREQIDDEATWWMLVYLRVYGQGYNQLKGHGQWYQVLLPHILGEGIEAALGHSADKDGNNVAWPFEPLNSTNDNLCCKSCLRVCLHVLPCWTSPCTHSEIDSILGHILTGLAKELETELDKALADEEAWLRSDALLVQSACKQMARQSLQRQPTETFAKTLENIMSKVGAMALLDSPEGMSSELPLGVTVEDVSFPHFGYIACMERGVTHGQRGKELAFQVSSGNSSNHVYLASLCKIGLLVENGAGTEKMGVFAAACNCFREALLQIKTVEKICNEVRSGSDSELIQNLKICSLIESLFCRVLPMPFSPKASQEGKDADSFWNIILSLNNESSRGSHTQQHFKTREQCQLLQSVYELVLIYTSAWLPLSSDRISQSTNLITMGSMISIFDAGLRLRPNDWKPGSFLSGDIICGRGYSGTMGWSTDAFDGSRNLRTVFENLHVEDPDLLIRRAEVMVYFEANEAHEHKMFAWKLDCADQHSSRRLIFAPKESDVTLNKLIEPILRSRGSFDSFSVPLPQHLKEAGGSFPRPKNVHEKLCHWSITDWNTDREVQMIRDLTMIFKFCMEPEGSRETLKEHILKKKLYWGLGRSSTLQIQILEVEGGKTIESAVNLDVLSVLHEECISLQAMVKKMLVDPSAKTEKTKTEKIDYFHIGLEVEDVLYSKYLPTFNSLVNQEESEKLLSYCAVPQLMIPMVLSFFESRVHLLMNADMVLLLQAVLFECNTFLATLSEATITTIPVPMTERKDILGTPHGVLMNDLKYNSDVVLSSILEICENCSKICVGNIDSPFVELLAFVIRIAVSIETCCSNEEQNVPARCKIRTWLQGSKAKLLEWLDEATAVGDLQAELFLHIHLFLVASTVAGHLERSVGESYNDILGDFFCSSTFLTSWCDSVSLGSGGLSVSAHLLRKVFASLEKLKGCVIDDLEKMAKADVNDFERIMDKITAVALRRKTMKEAEGSFLPVGQKSWLNSDPVLEFYCEKIYESPHPYLPCTDLFDSVSFPGASFIEVTFDANTSTQEDDFLTFFKDDSFTEYWGTVRTYGGNSASDWPGLQGNPPLIVPADHFSFQFHSGPGGGRKDWGYKFTARAPVCLEAAETLAIRMQKNSAIKLEGSKPTLDIVCRLALKFMHNCVDSAETHLFANYEELRKEAELRQEEAHKNRKGVYQRMDPESQQYVVLNLQASRVFISGQNMRPLPQNLSDNVSFVDVFGLSAKNAQKVMVMSQSKFENVDHLCIEHQGMTYFCEVWKPIVAMDYVQLQIEQNRRDWKVRLDSKSGEKVEDWKIMDLAGLDATVSVPQMPIRRDGSNDLQYLGHIYRHVDPNQQLSDKMTSRLASDLPDLCQIQYQLQELFHELPSMTASDLPDLCWIQHFLRQAKRHFRGKKMRSPPQLWVRSDTSFYSDVQDTKAKGHQSGVPPLLMYTPAESTGTGCFCEIFQVVSDTHVFALLIKGRNVVRSLVYTSNGRMSLSTPSRLLSASDSRASKYFSSPSWQQEDDSEDQWLRGCLFAAGSMRVKTEDDVSPSVLITRKRYKPRVENEKKQSWYGSMAAERLVLDQWETYISPDCLYGLIPEALLDAYKFWKCGPRVLQGYPRSFREVDLHDHTQDTSMPDETLYKAQVQNQIWAGSMILVDMQKDSGALIYRLPNDPMMDESVREDASERERLQEKAKSYKPMILVDASRASGKLKDLAATFSRLDSLSHVLFWSELMNNGPKPRDERTLLQNLLVELPRLRLLFRTRPDSLGNTRLFCESESCLFVVSEAQPGAQQACVHSRDIRHGIWLQNEQADMFLLLPNLYVQRRPCKGVPLSAEYLTFGTNKQMQSEWCRCFPMRYFLYPLHTSGVMLRPSSLASRMYLIYVFMVVHRYDDAALQISSAFSDTALSPDEDLLTRWILNENTSIIKQHPDAIACRLRIESLRLSAGTDPVSELGEMYAAYLAQLLSVSSICRLEPAEINLIKRRLRIDSSGDALSLHLGYQHPGSLQQSMLRVFEQCVKAFNARPPIEVPHSLQIVRTGDDCCEVAWKVVVPGLKWENVGVQKPKIGTEIINHALAEALERKTEFSKEEIGAFQVPNLLHNSYIKVGDSYFQQQNENTEQSKSSKCSDCIDENIEPTIDYATLEDAFFRDMLVPPLLGVHVELCGTTEGSWRMLMPQSAKGQVQVPALQTASLSSAKVVGLSPHESYSIRLSVMNRVGTGPTSAVAAVPKDVSERPVAAIEDEKHKIPSDDDGKAPIFGQLPFIKCQYSRPGVAAGKGQFANGQITGADTFAAFDEAVTGATDSSYFFLLFYDIALGKVKVGLKENSRASHEESRKGQSLLRNASGNDEVAMEVGWKCPSCSERNFPQSPSCCHCGHAYLYYSPETCEVGYAYPVATVNNTRENMASSLSYVRLLIKFMLFRNTSAGQKPLILSDRACELTLLSMIVQVVTKGDCLMPQPLYDVDDPSVHTRLRKGFLSFEHGAGLQFMRTLLDFLQQSDLIWMRKDVGAGDTVLLSAATKSDPLPPPPALGDQSKRNDDLIDSSFIVELHCEIHCCGDLSSGTEATVEEMKAFQTRPMQYFAHDDQECNMIEKYLCQQQTASLNGSETTLLNDLKYFKWASRESGRIWLERLEKDLKPHEPKQSLNPGVSGGPGHATFELKCFGAAMLRTIDGDGASNINIDSCLEPLGALQSEMGGLDKDLIRLLACEKERCLKSIHRVESQAAKWCDPHTKDYSGDARQMLSVLGGVALKPGFEQLLTAFASARPKDVIRTLNPHLDCDALQFSIACVLFRVTRVNQICRCLQACREVKESNVKLIWQLKVDLNANDAATLTRTRGLAKDLHIKIDILVQQLSAARTICVNKADVDYRNSVVVAFDSRFLVFEFLTGFMMRESQQKIIRDFEKSVRAKSGMVQQMLMGSGKSTVVAPMLSLLLSQPEKLVVQVVPESLLLATRDIMRSVFGCIWTRRVQVFRFDRTFDKLTDFQELVRSVREARQLQSVVCTSPASIKSLLLSYLDILLKVKSIPEALHSKKSELEGLPELTDDFALNVELMEQKADALGELLNLFSTSTAVIDEVDWILHPLKSETNFPIGDKHELSLRAERVELPIHLFDAVMVAGGERPRLTFAPKTAEGDNILAKLSQAFAEGIKNCWLKNSPHVLLLEKSFYVSDILEPMADWAWEWLRRQPVFFNSLNALAILDREGNNLHRSNELKDLAKRFVAGRCNVKERKSLQNTLESVNATKAIPILHLGRMWLTQLLPHCLSKRSRIDFGLIQDADVQRWVDEKEKHELIPKTREEKDIWSKIPMTLSRKLLAIPFSGKDVPSRMAEFSNPDISIGLTVLAYMYEGMRQRDVVDLVNHQSRALSNQAGPMDQREVWLRFQSYIDEAMERYAGEPVEILPLDCFQVTDEKQIKSLTLVASRVSSMIYDYLQIVVFPMKNGPLWFASRKLQASGIDVGGNAMFDLVLGFSGTPSRLLPTSLGDCQFESGSEAKIVRVLTSKNVIRPLYPGKSDPLCQSLFIDKHSWTVEAVLLAVANANPPYHALIDTGALITGFSSEEVARFLLDHGLREFHACVFINTNNEQMAVVRSATGLQARAVPLQQCGVDLSHRFVFFDQIHTTGTDVKLTVNACAMATIGKGMTLRDHAQGCWRMRGLGQGQTIHVLLVHEIKRSVDRLSDLLNKTSGTEAEGTGYHRTGDDDQKVLVSLLGWLQSHGVESEEMQLKQFSLKEMQNCWRHQAFKQLLESRSPRRVRGRAKDEPFLITRFHSRGRVRYNEALDHITLTSVLSTVAKWPKQNGSAPSMSSMSLQESRWRVIQAILKVPRNMRVARWLYGYRFFSFLYGTFARSTDSKFPVMKRVHDDFETWWEWLDLPDRDKIFKIDRSAANASFNHDASTTVISESGHASSQLNEAIAIFDEKLDHTLPQKLEFNPNVLQSICERRDHFAKIRLCDENDMSTFEKQRESFSSLTGGEPGEDSLDSEQEQEQEQEQEKEQEIEEDCLFSRPTLSQEPWKLEFVQGNKKIDPAVLQPVRNFQLVQKGTPPQNSVSLQESSLRELFPSGMLASKNFGKADSNFSDATIRLHNPEVMVLFLGDSCGEDKDDAADGGHALFTLFLTLSEAETLRWAMHRNPKAFNKSAATLLRCKHLTPTEQSGSDALSWDRLCYSWNSLLLSKDQISDKIQQRELSQILCCTKVFDSYMYVNPAETALLLRSLCAAGARKSEEGGAVSSERARVMLEERQQFFKCLVSSRRRSGHFEETPFSEVLSCVDFLEKKRKVENAETIRKAFQSAVSIDQLEASYCRYDTDQNGRLDHDELTLAIKHVCRADKSLAQSPELGDLNLVIRDTISVLDKKNTQSITFRQFTSFFFEGADITSSETQASEKMRKGPARRRCVSTRKQESKWSSKQQSADLPNFDQSPPVSIVIALARVPAHILFREVHLIGQLQPACMNKLPSALGSKWKDVGTQKPAKGQEITNEALAAKLQQQLEFTNEEWDNFKVSTLSDDSYIKAGDKYFKSAGGMRRKSASGMLMEPSLLVQAGCTVSTEASVPVTFVPKSVCIESGTFFYEVEIVTSSSAASLRVGWTDASFVGGELACGEPGSWAVTGKRPDAEADDVGADEDSSALQEHLQFFGVQCTPGSVIGCLVSVGEGEPYRTCTFRYCLSGQWDPPAGILVEKGQARIGVTPTLTISPGCKVRVNLGDRPFRFPNARVQQAASVFDWILAKQTFYLKQAAGALFGQCQAACGQSSVLVGAKSIANGMDLQTTTSQCFLVEPDWADWDFGKVTIKVAGFLQARGKWFYEVVLPSYPQLYVGWAGPAFVPKITNNVGQSQSSWAFKVCSWEPQLLHANRNTLSRKTREYKEIKRLLRQEGAIIGCAMDFDRGTMRFYFQWPKSHECKDLGIAFQGIQINGGLFPAVSAYSWENYSVCLGSSQCSNPPGWLAEYSPVANFFQPDSAADKSTGGRSINSSLQMTSDKQQLKLRVTSVQASWLVVEEARGQADQSLSDLTPLTVRGLYGYPSAKLDQVSLDSGAWYYEVTVLEKHERHPASVLSEDGVRTDEVEEDFDADESEAWQTYLPSVGWSDSSFIGSAELGIGLGQDRFSYGHCGLASDDADGTHRHYCVGRNNSRCWVGVTETRGTYKRMGCEWQVNDVVGCVLDCSERKIVFVHHRGAQEEPCIKIFQDIHLSGGMSPTITVPPMFKFALDFGSDTLSPGFEARMKGIKDIKDIGTIQHLRPVFNQGSRIRKKTPAMGSGSKKAGARGHAETRTDMDSQRNILELSFDNLDEFSKLDIHQHDDASHTKIQPDKIQSWYTTRICFNSMPGLSWKAVGPEKPSTGTEIVNESLAAALKQRIDGSLAVAQKQKVDFRREDYGTWHVAKLPHDSYIKAGNRYFVVSINNYDAYSDLQFKLEKMKDAFQIFSKTRVAKSLVCLEIVGAVPMLGNKDDIDPAVMRNLDDALQAALMASRSCLKELRCVACNMSWDGWGVRALAAVLDEHECLEMLELVSCELKQNGARALGEALQFASSLKQLKVQFALLDGVSVRHVILPLNPEHSLSSLDLSHNVIGISAAPTLCTLLRSYPALQSLILAHNGLGSASEALAQELAYNGTLTWLDISHNQIRNKGATAITEALRSNRTLKHLNVSKNNIFEDGMAKFETLFSDSAHPIREFVFWEDSVPEKTLIDLLFSLNRKPMHLIQFGNLVTLKGEIDWKCFFYRPLCFAVWCQWVVTAGLEIASGLKWKEVGVTKSTRIGRSERCLCNLPLADALTRKTEFTSEEWNSFGIRDLRYYDFIEAGGSYFKPAKPALTVPADADTMISNELIEQLILHRISSGMNKDLKAPMHVRRCDARDALRLAICMLRPTRAADGLGDSAWIIDQMLGRDGRLGIVLGTKQNFIATEPNYVFDRRTESYWNRSEDATYSGRQVQVQEAEYLIDLWSIGEHTFMYETGASMEYNHVFSGLIDQSFPWATGKHTALTLAVSHPWEVERDHRVAQRLLRRNRYHKCVLLDKNSESSYDYIIRDRVMHDPDDIGNPNLERNLRVFEAYPDLCNINARREWGVSVKLSALGLAVLHGMGEIVSILLRQNAMQHWEFRDCSSSEIDESLSYEVETEACGQKDIEHVWNHSPIIDRDTGLSFLSLVAQAEPGSLAHMLEFAKGLVVHCPNLISVPDKKGRLPIHYCAVKGHSQLLRLMLRACSSRERVSTILNKLDDDGFTALSLAVIHGQVEIIRLLLKHGAQVVPLKEAQPNLNSHAFELCLLQNIFLHREIERVSNAAHSNLKEKEVEPEPEKSSNIIKWMKNRFASRRISPAPLPRLSVPSVDRDGTHYFAKLDTDGDGQITRKEYDAGFDVLDTDDDGFITKEEFSRVSRAPFDMLDKDGDGKISMAEWKVGFLFFDTNMDGYISTNEFNAETGTEGLRNLQLAFKKSETQIQPIINESGEKVSATRNRFICGVLVRRILVYIFILGFLTVVAFCHSGQLGPHRNGFTLFRAWVKDKIMHESLTEGEEKYFADITNDGDFWEWAAGPLLKTVWNKDNPNATIGRYSYVVGAVRFQQKRNLFVDCASLGVLGPVSALVTQQCLSSLQNRSAYGPDASFSFNEASGLHVADITGADAANATKQIRALMHGMWIDSATMFVEVLLSVYNAQLDAMLCLTFIFSVPNSMEGLRPSSQIALMNWGSPGLWADFVTLIEGILIVGSLVSTPYLLYKWRDKLTTRFYFPQYFRGFPAELILPAANVKTAMMFSLFLIDAWSVLRIATFVFKNSTTFSSGRDAFVDLRLLAYIELEQSRLISVALVLLWLLLCADLQLIPILGPMIQAVISTIIHVRVITFIIFVLFVCFCFAIGCQLYFGYDLEAFWTLEAAVWTIFTDSFEIVEMSSSSGDTLNYHPMGVFFFLVMFIFITLTLLNIFIGLTGEVYGVMYAKSSFIWLKEVNDLMEEDLLKGKGLKSKASQWKKLGEERERESWRKSEGSDGPKQDQKCVCSACRMKAAEDISHTAPQGSNQISFTGCRGTGDTYIRPDTVETPDTCVLSSKDYERLLTCDFPNLMKIDLVKLDDHARKLFADVLIRRLVYRVRADAETEDVFSPDDNRFTQIHGGIQELKKEIQELKSKMEETSSETVSVSEDTSAAHMEAIIT